MHTIRFDPVLLKYYIGDTVLELPPAEMRVFNLLRFYKGRVLRTDDITTMIYGYAYSTNLVNVIAGRIRKKLAEIEPLLGNQLVNVRGFGYRWDGD